MALRETVLSVSLAVLVLWLVLPPPHLTETLVSHQMWQSIQVANWRLAFGKSSQMQTSSIIRCAQLANERPWSFLFCYHEHNNSCSIQSLKVPAAFEDNHNDVTICHTRLSKDYDMCEPPFTNVSNLGCIYGISHPLLNWDDARSHCQKHHHADLVVPEAEAFSLLLTYHGTTGFGWTWVGMQSRKWLDGRSVSDSEWLPGQPNDEVDTCGEIYHSEGMSDFPCSQIYPFICEISAH